MGRRIVPLMGGNIQRSGDERQAAPAAPAPIRETILPLNKDILISAAGRQADGVSTTPTSSDASAAPRPVAIITGGRGGIGAGLAAAFPSRRLCGRGHVASIAASDESDLLAVPAISQTPRLPARCRVALGRFGRIDSLVNNAGVFIGKPFTDYTPDDYAAIPR